MKNLWNQFNWIEKGLILIAAGTIALYGLDKIAKYNAQIVQTRQLQNQTYQGWYHDIVNGDTMVVFDPMPKDLRDSNSNTVEVKGHPRELGINPNEMGKEYKITIGTPRKGEERIIQSTPVPNYNKD